jgi:hypothetical protein
MSADPHSEATYFSVLALRRLGRDADARRRTESLRTFVDELETTPVAVDYFATSLPSMLLFAEDPAVARARRVAFLRAQLDVLDGAPDRARERFEALLSDDPHHIDALELLSDLRPVFEEAPSSLVGAVLRGRRAGSEERATEHRRSRTAPGRPASTPERSGGNRE